MIAAALSFHSSQHKILDIVKVNGACALHPKNNATGLLTTLNNTLVSAMTMCCSQLFQQSIMTTRQRHWNFIQQNKWVLHQKDRYLLHRFSSPLPFLWRTPSARTLSDWKRERHNKTIKVFYALCALRNGSCLPVWARGIRIHNLHKQWA